LPRGNYPDFAGWQKLWNKRICFSVVALTRTRISQNRIIMKYTYTKLSLLLPSLVLGVALAVQPAQAQTCELFPIALSQETLANVEPGTVCQDILNGTGLGQFGWLSWAGNQGEPTLAGSLTQAGDSYSYVNPLDANDHTVNIGDWVVGRSGVSNSRAVRDALAALKNNCQEIVVPVYDTAVKENGVMAYRVVGFARVQIVSYQLASENRISARFLGYASCGNDWL